MKAVQEEGEWEGGSRYKDKYSGAERIKLAINAKARVNKVAITVAICCYLS